MRCLPEECCRGLSGSVARPTLVRLCSHGPPGVGRPNRRKLPSHPVPTAKTVERVRILRMMSGADHSQSRGQFIVIIVVHEVVELSFDQLESLEDALATIGPLLLPPLEQPVGAMFVVLNFFQRLMQPKQRFLQSSGRSCKSRTTNALRRLHSSLQGAMPVTAVSVQNARAQCICINHFDIDGRET